ncbi:MAG: acetate--CoA ligase [Bacteroidia bacterium]|nr:acetate--CoA ligase [Bacteroidia bacterium]
MAESNQILSQSGSVYPAPLHVVERAWISPEAYHEMHKRSVTDPEGFWGELAEKELEFFQKWDKVREWNYPNYKWFLNAKMNITHNCLDRHVRDGRGDKIAFIYNNEKNEEEKISYAQLLTRVKKMANALQNLGLQKGDRVAFYMPLTLEQIVAILACARIGVVHTIIFAGFSANALRMRCEIAEAKVVFASTSTSRRGNDIDLMHVVNEAVEGLKCVQNVIVHVRKGDSYSFKSGQLDYQTLLESGSENHEAPALDAEDPLFILYTSGTTGKPKGVLHTQAGYNLFTHFSTRVSFDLHEEDIFWCTADTGWITGHSYIVYGPLSLGVTSVIVEGAPTFPNPGSWWALVEKYKVNVFYTAPTAVRLFMKLGAEWPNKYDLSSLRILGSVGEPINPEAWEWYYEAIGRKNVAVVDTWWQTETGGHMIVTMPSMDQKPGKAGLPFFGVDADVVDRQGNPVAPNAVGFLVVRQPWPSALRTCYGEPERFNNYWMEMKGFYYPGDFATKDEDGYITILGRADDVLNVSGHRIGTAEVESALVAHESIAEAAVIGKPHPIKGESIKAFVIAMNGVQVTDQLIQEVKDSVAKELGKLAQPDEIEFVEGLPKTRSGKIMRRVLKAKEMGTELGDTSTLED